MIRLSFIMGSNMRRVVIDKDVITLLTPEVGYPIIIDLNKIDDKIKNKMDKEQLILFDELSKLTTEEEKAKDIIDDFLRSGWRLFKRE